MGTDCWKVGYRVFSLRKTRRSWQSQRVRSYERFDVQSRSVGVKTSLSLRETRQVPHRVYTNKTHRSYVDFGDVKKLQTVRDADVNIYLEDKLCVVQAKN